MSRPALPLGRYFVAAQQAVNESAERRSNMADRTDRLVSLVAPG